jgi:hypothetical protein
VSTEVAERVLVTVRLALISNDDLAGQVRGSHLISADKLLDAATEKAKKEAKKRK